MAAIDILSADFARNPYPYYQQLRDHHPLMYHEATNSYLLSRYEDVEKAFKDPVFTTRNYIWQLEPVHGKTILQMDGREHSTYRNLVAPAFRGRDLMNKFVPVIRRNAQELLHRMLQKQQADFANEFASIFPVSVIVDMLGLPRQDIPQFHHWYTNIINFLSNLTQDPVVHGKGLETQKEFRDYMVPVIETRRKNPGEDLLSILCTASIDGVQMTDEEIKAFCSLLLTAGGETTDKALTSMLKNLLEHPGQMDAVKENAALLEQAFAETLRYSPPVHMIMRQTAAAVAVSGGTIPADATVTCLIGAANRDGNRYQDPDTFNIFRQDLSIQKAFTGAADHTAFGLGRHFCVGAVLARMEVLTAFEFLLEQTENLQIGSGGFPEEAGIFTRAPETLHITFQAKQAPVAS